MRKLDYDERLTTFLETEIKKQIIKNLRQYRLFSERDMHGVVYHSLRTALGDKKDWFVRCEPKMGGFSPDIVIFNLYNPKVVIELTFSSGRGFPHSKVQKDMKKLRRLKRKYPKMGKGYLIVIYNSPTTFYLKEQEEWQKRYYREILINVRDEIKKNYKRWKDDWLVIKERQK